MKNNFESVPQGYKHAGQSPLDAKYLIENIDELDYTLNPTLPFTFYDGYLVYIYALKGFYIWTDQLSNIDSNASLFPTSFTYPQGSVYSEIDYSGKAYNFVKVSIIIGGTDSVDTITVGNLSGHIDLASSIGEDNKGQLVTLRNYLSYLYKRNNILQFVDNLFAFTISDSIRESLDDAYKSNSMFYTFGNSAYFNNYNTPTVLTIIAQRRPETLPGQETLPANGFISSLSSQIFTLRNQSNNIIVRMQSHDGHFIEFYVSTKEVVKFYESLSGIELSFQNFNSVSKITLNGKQHTKFGSIQNKPVKIFVYSAYSPELESKEINNKVIKKDIISFTRKQIIDNNGVFQHNLNIDRYLSEHFSYPTGISGQLSMPVSLSPTDLLSDRVISKYGPNDANTIFLKDIEGYNLEDENDLIYYIVKYIENNAFDLSIPETQVYAIQQNNDHNDILKDFQISPEIFVQNLYDPNVSIENIDLSNYQIYITQVTFNTYNDDATYDSVQIDSNTIIDLNDIKDFVVTVEAVGGNRNVMEIDYKVTDGTRESNIGTFIINKISEKSNKETPPIINPTYLLTSAANFVSQWGSQYRLIELVGYRLQALVSSENQIDGLEVTFEVYDETENRQIYLETILNVSSGSLVTSEFDFDYTSPNNVLHEISFKFRVMENDGLLSETVKKLYIIY